MTMSFPQDEEDPCWTTRREHACTFEPRTCQAAEPWAAQYPPSLGSLAHGGIRANSFCAAAGASTAEFFALRSSSLQRAGLMGAH
jgi:hypothetical protein